MKTHKFARKPFYVDAIRVTEDNIVEVAAWCQGDIKTDEEGAQYIKVRVHRPLTEDQTKAYVGKWILFAGTGYKVYTPQAFDKSFEKVKHLSKAQADEAGIKVPHEPRSKSKPNPKQHMPRKKQKGLTHKVGDALQNSLGPVKEVVENSTSATVEKVKTIAEEQAEFASTMVDTVKERDELDSELDEILRD